jgi:DNA-binding MarR family transcriptional regulator
MVGRQREKTKDYRIIFDLLDMKPRIQFTEIAEELGVDVRTASRRLKEAVESGYIVGPQIRKKSFSNFKTYMYLVSSARPLKLFDEYIENDRVLYHEVLEGFCNLLVMSDVKLDIEGTILGGLTSDYYISHPPDQSWRISSQNMWDMVRKFDPADYTPKGYIETHWNETVKWSEQYEILFWEFKYNLRKALEPLVKQKYHIWSGDGIEFLEQLSRYCTIFTCYFQEMIDNYDPYLYIFETDYEDFVIDLFSQLPTTCWFQRVSGTLIAHLWTIRGKMRKIDTRNKNFPELQISLLIQELLERGIIRKENHSYREFYWRKEIGDI